MYPYPTSVREEIGTLLTALAHPAVTPDAVRAAWAVLGFGLSLGFGADRPLVISGFADDQTEGRLAELLAEAHAALPPEGEGAAGDTTIPWALILPLVFQFLQKWLLK